MDPRVDQAGDGRDVGVASEEKQFVPPAFSLKLGTRLVDWNACRAEIPVCPQCTDEGPLESMALIVAGAFGAT